MSKSSCGRLVAAFAAVAWAAALHAQSLSMSARTMLEATEQHGASGTSVEPASTRVPMIMAMRGPWMLMLHANAFAANTQQQASHSRGRDAWFSTNWIMPMAQRQLGEGGRAGELTLRAMLSFEPGTIGRRNYPELFQQGETAFGAPIVDGQHPHDFIMELAALYDLKLGGNALLSLYAAPVGDPALGPTAYPHRLSASENPIGALGHHQQDSTHIAFNVLTGGLTYKWARVEFSGFHGGEPTEARWQPEPSANGHALDSYATRLTVSPTADWTGQYSVAHITSPEALHPHEDQQRQTASVMYHHTFGTQKSVSMQPHAMPCNMPGMQHEDSMAPRSPDSNAPHHATQHEPKPGMQHDSMQPETTHAAPPPQQHETMPAMQHNDMVTTMQHGSMMPMHMAPEPATDLALTALWGRTKSLADASRENSYLLEALLRFARSNYAWTRLENAGRSNELLLTPGTPLPADFREQPIGHVAAFTFGYDHDVPLGRHVLAAPGLQITAFHTPRALVAIYGATPSAEVFFVRFRMR